MTSVLMQSSGVLSRPQCHSQSASKSLVDTLCATHWCTFSRRRWQGSSVREQKTRRAQMHSADGKIHRGILWHLNNTAILVNGPKRIAHSALMMFLECLLSSSPYKWQSAHFPARLLTCRHMMSALSDVSRRMISRDLFFHLRHSAGEVGKKMLLT